MKVHNQFSRPRRAMLTDFLFLVAALAIALVVFYKRRFQYWRRKGVPFAPPAIPFGSMENPFSRKLHMGQLMKRYYDGFKAEGARYGGLFSFATPVFMPVDPEVVKDVMQKDFQHFVDRGFYYNEQADPLSGHLFAVGGQKWRNLRTKLTPTFTSGKMKMMFETLVACSENMLEALRGRDLRALDVKDVVARFTTDIIGSCAFGLECNSFRDSDAEFRRHGKNIFAPLSRVKAVLNVFAQAMPEVGHFLGLYFLPRDSSAFFYSIIDQAVSYREKNNFTRNDMLQLLINLKNKEDGLTMDEVTAQALIFFLAGFETSSTTMTFCMYELCQHPDMQDRVRQEIEVVLKKYNGRITYDSIVEMTYLGQVVDETLRKYPPLPFLTRKCVQDYVIPGTKIVVEKGDMVFLPVLGLQHDPDYFPEPEKFDPERFSEANRKRFPAFAYLPFGEGPRMCIGLRFGMMQTKLGLISLLRNYRFTLNEKTKVPLSIDQYSTTIYCNKDCVLLDGAKL